MIDPGEPLALPFFPLPNFVLFPGVFAPLHVFEPRYRQLVERAIDSDGRFCLGTLVQGWQPADYEVAAFCECGCVCEIADYQRLDDGRYNIMVRGLTAATVEEISSTGLYRSVSAIPYETLGADAVGEELLAALRETVMERLLENDVDATELAPHLEQMLANDLIDCVAFLAPVDEAVKLASLAATTYEQRCRLILAGMTATD